MDTLTLVVLALGGGTCAVWLALQQYRRMSMGWRDAARARGLVVDERASTWDVLCCRTGTLAVRLESYTSRNDRGMSVEIRDGGNALATCSVHGDPDHTPLPTHERTLSGDAAFDAEVVVTGP